VVSQHVVDGLTLHSLDTSAKQVAVVSHQAKLECSGNVNGENPKTEPRGMSEPKLET
jgi:hypothetical protein